MGGRRFFASASVAVAGLLFAVPAAQASFHLIKVREVYPGTSAHPDSGYVELQMYASGQYLVQFGQLEVLNSTGSVTNTFTPGSSVASSANQSTVLISDTEFASQFGITPDFTDAGLSLDPAGGAVCWPQTEPPFDDCASWGTFTGQASLPSPGDASPAAPAGIPNGMAIRRSIAANCSTLLENADDTNDSSADFSVQAPNPRNNATPPSETACSFPSAVIDSGPASSTNSASASFTYHSNPAGASFECKLDAEPFASCESSGIGYPGPLSEGSHTFQVRATNVNGTGAPASYPWKVDLTAPTATITSQPVDPSPGSSASFKYQSDELGSTFECSLTSGGSASFSPCPSTGKTYTNLADGNHTFEVRATDPAGNQSTPGPFPDGSYTWTVDNSLADTTPPETTILSTPPDPSESSTASFTYESNELGSSFECGLDAAAFASCPASGIVYTGLANGSHTFLVRAIDANENVDPTPAGYSFDVEVAAPPPAMLPDPASLAPLVPVLAPPSSATPHHRRRRCHRRRSHHRKRCHRSRNHRGHRHHHGRSR